MNKCSQFRYPPALVASYIVLATILGVCTYLICFVLIPEMRVEREERAAIIERTNQLVAKVEQILKDVQKERRTSSELVNCRNEMIHQHSVILRQQERMVKRLSVYEGE